MSSYSLEDRGTDGQKIVVQTDRRSWYRRTEGRGTDGQTESISECSLKDLLYDISNGP